ncbi:MAG: glycosidase [Solirubrobacterales bacterium]|nr:glycosidase [Solirubrobacterales bacterium]
MPTPPPTGFNSASLFSRHPGNPLLAPERWPYPINAVMNAGATRVDDATVLLCRVEDRRGFSHLTCARSRDGVSNWVVDDEPALSFDGERPEEEWGLEDPRVTRVDELDRWVITYTAFGPGGPGISLAATADFRTFERLGMIMVPEDKNGVLLPRRVGGDWILFHRPTSIHAADIWMSRSTDLKSWRTPELVIQRRPGGWWDSARVGMGPPPIETDAGWLVVYHGVRTTVAGGLYRAGLALLDLENPARVLHRSPEWVLGPQEQFETTGDVPNVVFPCGLTRDEATDRLNLYYGAADTRIGLATATCSTVLEYLLSCPAG